MKAAIIATAAALTLGLTAGPALADNAFDAAPYYSHVQLVRYGGYRGGCYSGSYPRYHGSYGGYGRYGGYGGYGGGYGRVYRPSYGPGYYHRPYSSYYGGVHPHLYYRGPRVGFSIGW